jgi:hypothetical protein
VGFLKAFDKDSRCKLWKRMRALEVLFELRLAIAKLYEKAITNFFFSNKVESSIHLESYKVVDFYQNCLVFLLIKCKKF